MDSGETRSRPAGVVVPLLLTPTPQILFVVRSHFGIHGNQIAFPGGMAQEGDATLYDTAAREAHEECLLDPTRLSLLTPLPTTNTYVSDIAVTPFIATSDQPPEELAPDGHEIMRLILCPLSWLVEPQRRGSRPWPTNGTTRPSTVHALPTFVMGDDVVWGLTYRIVEMAAPYLTPYLEQ